MAANREAKQTLCLIIEDYSLDGLHFETISFCSTKGLSSFLLSLKIQLKVYFRN